MDSRGHLVTDDELERIRQAFGDREADRYEPLPDEIAVEAARQLDGLQETRIDGPLARKAPASLHRFLAKIRARRELKRRAAVG